MRVCKQTGYGLIMAAMALPALAGADPESKTVYMTTFSAQPAVLSVPVGTTVTWKNYDEITHSVVLPDERSERLWAYGWKGQAFSKTFHQPGEFSYRCGVHNDVHGKILVTAAGGSATQVPGPAYPGNTLSGLPRTASTPSQHAAAPVAAAPPAAAPASVSSGGALAVSISHHAFSPVLLKVAQGQAVSWSNQDGSTHQLLFADQRSERLGRGDSYSRRFDQPGDYPYQCAIHGYMKGKISVGNS